MSDETKVVLVTGDFLIDHHIYEGRRHQFAEQAQAGVRVLEELGGAGLVHRLAEALAAGMSVPVRSILSIDGAAALQSNHKSGANTAPKPFGAYAFWRVAKKDKVWRVAQSMGFGGDAADSASWPWMDAAELPAAPDVLMIADGGMGFRARMNACRWRIPVKDAKFIKELVAAYEKDNQVDRLNELKAGLASAQEPKWIVLKASSPLAQGDLWRELVAHHAERLITVVSASELRLAGVRLGYGLSWEQSLEELHRELESHTTLSALKNSRHLIVSFGMEGAMLLSRNGDGHRAHFTFDPLLVEGELRAACEGEVYGLLSCLASTVAVAAAQDTVAPDLSNAVKQGLVAMRHLLRNGHGAMGTVTSGFPAAALASAVLTIKGGSGFATREFACEPATCPVKQGWNLISTPQPPGPAGVGIPLFGMAHQVLIKGLSALQSPTLKIGGFVTADRSEIEAVRSLKLLIARYLENEKAKKPLSIGVFGTPGSGKSFAVEQLAKSGTFGEKKLGWLEFNLSQFNDARDLIGAFHQIRDSVLKGEMPVAFFDEFDAQKFKWLKDLLAPMQDGRFQEGQVSHPIGKCLFIFAGGTSFTYDEFAARAGNVLEGAKNDDEKEFRLLKGSDFASRLDGILNVVGPNPRRPGPGGAGADILYPVRRAIFIRENLGCGSEERLAVDPAMATVLLEVKAYKNGSRSLTKLLEPFKEARQKGPQGLEASIRPSGLLPPDQLALHVDLKHFNDLLVRDTEAVLALGIDKLAAVVHSYYRELGQKEGWITESLDCEFADLSTFLQESNRAAARRIPRVLALAGLKVEKGVASAAEESTAGVLIEFHLELLSEAEHDLWMDWHLMNGWKQSSQKPPVRNDAEQTHKLMIRYSELKDVQKDKDRNAVRAYVAIARLAGLRIVPSM